jgi:alkanesulfonate monooxygenase
VYQNLLGFNVMEEFLPMHVEFTHVTAPSSPLADATPFFFDPFETRRRVAALEGAGFSRIVIDDAGGVLTNMDLAAQVARLGAPLDIALTHWAGVVEPAEAARQFAALDRASCGNLSVRMVAGDMGTAHLAGLKRTDEYLVLLKRLWTNDRPFDHEGAAYSLRAAFLARKGPRGADIPIRMSGLSGTAFWVAGRHATVFELPFAQPGHLRHVIDRVRAAASEAGRTSRVSFAMPLPFDVTPSQGDGTGDSLVNAIRQEAPERLALALLPHLEAGVSEFLVRGLVTYRAIEDFGERLAPILRNSAAHLSLRDGGGAIKAGVIPHRNKQPLWAAH